MARILLVYLTAIFLVFSAHAQLPQTEWVRETGCPSSFCQFAVEPTADYIFALPDGSTYLIGMFEGTTDPDTDMSLENMTTEDDVRDVFIIKRNADGDVLWYRDFAAYTGPFNNPTTVTLTGCGVDDEGDLYVAGNYFGVLYDEDISGTQLTEPSPTNNYSTFLMRLSTEGEIEWVNALPLRSDSDAGLASRRRNTLLVRGDGTLFIRGRFPSSIIESVDMDPSEAGELILNQVSPALIDHILASYTSNGDLVWAKTLGADQADGETSVSMMSGSFAFTEQSGETIALGLRHNGVPYYDRDGDEIQLEASLPEASRILLISSENGDLFDQRLLSETEEFGSTVPVYLEKLSDGRMVGVLQINSGGTFYVNETETIEFTETVSGPRDVIYYLNPDLSVQSYVPFLESSDLEIHIPLQVDNQDNLYIFGEFTNEAQLDPANNPENLLSHEWAGSNRTFIARWNSEGEHVWSRMMGDDLFSRNIAQSIAINSSGVIYMGGRFSNTSNFALDPNQDEVSLTANSSQRPSLFTMRVPQCIYDIEIEESACNSFLWEATGETYTESGFFTTTLENINGCDSTVSLNLSIFQSEESSENQIACDSFTWSANGLTYSENGSYETVLQTVNGCDSTVTLNLTLQEEEIIENETACDSFTWPVNNSAYSSSGTYIATFNNVFGCDSTRVLNLTVNESNSGEQNLVECASYTWPATGETYTESGNYSAVLTNAAGCDSTVTLNLTINPAYEVEVDITACSSYTWELTGETFEETGNYSTTLSTVNGCDSVVTLDLQLLDEVYEETVNACESYTWDVTGETYTESGAYTASFTSVSGCDSSYVLELEITNVIAEIDLTQGFAQSQFEADSYLWLFCGEEEPVSTGVTSVNYTGEDALIQLVVELNGCVDTSACVQFISVEDLSSQAGFNIFPNPATNILVFEWDKNIFPERASGEIVNTNGKVVSEFTAFRNQPLPLDNSLPSGTYVVRLQSDEAVLTRRFIVIK